MYDAQRERCKERLWARDCVLPNCATVQAAGRYVPNANEPSLYYLCVGDADTTVVVMRCPDAVGQEFSEPEQRCVERCTRLGRFADRDDCRGYSVCYWSVRALRMLRSPKQRCWPGWHFSSSLNVCVLGASCRRETTTEADVPAADDVGSATTCDNDDE